MKCALVIFEREPAVMRCLEFIAKFATSLKGTEEDTMDELARNAEDEEKGELNKFLLKLFAFCLNVSQHIPLNSDIFLLVLPLLVTINNAGCRFYFFLDKGDFQM